MAKKRTVKVAVIGAGGMSSRVHCPSLAQLPDVQLVGVCDIAPGKAEALAAKIPFKATFTDYRKMLDETKPDAVYVLMPPHHLFDIAMDVIERGHALFVEKPPAITAFQAECLGRAADSRKLVTGAGFQRRFHPLFLRCQKEVAPGGPVHQVVATFYKNSKALGADAPHPYYRGAIDILTSDAIHAVDMCRFYAGGSVVKVASAVRKGGCWFDTAFNSIITFDNGATAILLANWRTGGRRLCLELHTPGYSAFANADGAGEVLGGGAKEPIFRSTYTEAAGSQDEYVAQGFLNQARAFVDAVKSGKPGHNTITDGARTMRLVEQIYASTM